jgi:hypothetical protein
MRDALLTYFAGERQSAFAWGFAGLVSLTVAVGIWRWAGGYKAMMWPLVIFGLIQVGAACAVYLPNPARVAKLEAQLSAEPQKLHADEEKRITNMNQLFTYLKLLWVALVLVGGALTVMNKSAAMFAVGMGLILQGATTFVLDSAAARRSEIYAEALSRSKP